MTNLSTAKPALALRAATVRHGHGCEFCRTGEETINKTMNKNRCQVCGTVWAMRDVALEVYPGEILGIVGESGSGKTTLMKSMYLDLPDAHVEGTYTLACYGDGEENIFDCSAAQAKYVRNHLLGMVYQNPHLGLRMAFSSSANVAEKLIAAGERNVASMMERTASLLSHMEVPTERLKEPPIRFSGGMQQRVQIAKAVANNPPVLLLDEITTGLDLSVQAKVLDLVRRIQRELNVTMVVVSHDLAVIRLLADRTLVMLDGRVVERGITDQILEDPQHPYTQTLVHSLL